jgi:predicted nucleotidyltransferase
MAVIQKQNLLPDRKKGNKPVQSISSLLFSDYRRRVLGLLLLNPEQSYHVREIARLTGTTAGTLHKELSKLASAGVLARVPRGNQIAYSADRTCPIFDELAGIMRKTSGLADVIAQAFLPVLSNVTVTFVFGSVAQAKETSNSDVDVMVIGNLSFAEVVRLLYPTQSTLGREINPKVFTVDEWRSKLKVKDAFVRDVLAKPKIFLIGNDNDLKKLAGR